MFGCRFGFAAAFSVALGLGLIPIPQTPAEEGKPTTLRICADPDNMPFSSKDPVQKGLYLEFANLIAKDLRIATEVFWWRSYFGKRTVRLTLLAERCDIHVGLPFKKGFMGRRVALTKPFLKTGYAIVVPKDMPFTGLGDLRGKTVGVLFNTPPQNLLAEQDGIATATFTDSDKAMEALAEGEIDGAFIWGPTAGYYNKAKLNGAYRVIPTEGPRLTWQVAMGVRGRDKALRDLLDREIDRLKDKLERLKAKYGLPLGEPLVLDWLARPAKPSRRGELGGEPTASQLAAARAPDPPGPSAEDVVRGRRLYNGVLGCSHCHGPNAVGGDRRRDLRRLRKRHGDRADEVFRVTVLKGQTRKGMPAWEGRISEEELAKIKLYLDSVQID